jgi:hypothetical protein
VIKLGNIHLVTGYAGYQHITSADQAVFNALTFGDGQYVLNHGNKFAASIVTNNIVNILDGDILMQGRHIRLNEATSVDLTIENGAQGYSRNDLVVVRYTRDANTGIEDANLVVIKGMAAQSDPADPEYTSGNVLGDASTNEMPLYRVRVVGLNIVELVPLFEVTDIDTIKTLTEYHTHTHTAADVKAVSKSGDTMTGTLSINAGTGSVASLIPYGGQFIIRNELNSKNRQDIAFGQGTIRFLNTVNSSTSAYDILHTGNLTSKTVGLSKVVTGTYTGTGAFGAGNKNSVALPAEPSLFMVMQRDEGARYGMRVKGSSMLYSANHTSSDGCNCTASWDSATSTLSWYYPQTNNASGGQQLNTNGIAYVYMAIY